jgi:hypothetical protein
VYRKQDVRSQGVPQLRLSLKEPENRFLNADEALQGVGLWAGLSDDLKGNARECVCGRYEILGDRALASRTAGCTRLWRIAGLNREKPNPQIRSISSKNQVLKLSVSEQPRVSSVLFMMAWI